MTDDEIIALAGEYVLGLLEGDALAQAEALRARDLTFQKAIQTWEWQLMGMAEDIPAVAPPEHVWSRIQSAIGQESAAQAPPTAAKRTKNRRWRWGFAAGGLAAAAVLVALFFSDMFYSIRWPPDRSTRKPRWRRFCDHQNAHLPYSKTGKYHLAPRQNCRALADCAKPKAASRRAAGCEPLFGHCVACRRYSWFGSGCLSGTARRFAHRRADRTCHRRRSSNEFVIAAFASFRRPAT